MSLRFGAYGSSEATGRIRFPWKLYDAASCSQGVVRWNQAGTGIVVNERTFEAHVMDRHRGLVKIASFTNFRRQLRCYGFRWRRRADRRTFEFMHPDFVRDRPELLVGVLPRNDIIRSRPVSSGLVFRRPRGRPRKNLPRVRPEEGPKSNPDKKPDPIILDLHGYEDNDDPIYSGYELEGQKEEKPLEQPPIEQIPQLIQTNGEDPDVGPQSVLDPELDAVSWMDLNQQLAVCLSLTDIQSVMTDQRDGDLIPNDGPQSWIRGSFALRCASRSTALVDDLYRQIQTSASAGPIDDWALHGAPRLYVPDADDVIGADGDNYIITVL